MIDSSTQLRLGPGSVKDNRWWPMRDDALLHHDAQLPAENFNWARHVRSGESECAKVLAEARNMPGNNIVR